MVSPQDIAPALLVAGLIALSACSAPTEVDRPGDENQPGFHIAGYHPWWMQDSWREQDYALVKELIFFDIAVAGDGTISTRNGWPESWADLLYQVRKSGGSVVPAATILDATTFVTLFDKPQHTKALRQHLVELVREAPVAGLHLDFEVFEPVTPYVRRAFTSFVRDLRADLDGLRPGIRLTLFGLAFDASDVYDVEALAEYVDYFVVQGYDLHWSGSEKAGPVAAVSGWDQMNWKAIVDRYLALGVPRSKIVMAVPYFGYEWPTESDVVGSNTRGTGSFTTYAPLVGLPESARPASARERAEQYGLRRDVESGSPYYAFQDSTGWFQGWFEDAASLKAKYDFVKRQQLGGVAIFPLGYGDASLDAALREAFAPGSVAPKTTVAALDPETARSMALPKIVPEAPKRPASPKLKLP